MDQKELTQSFMNELYALPEDKIQEVKDFVHFLKYKSNPEFSLKNKKKKTTGSKRKVNLKDLVGAAEFNEDSSINHDFYIGRSI